MKKILRNTLLLTFCLATTNQLLGNLVFQQNIATIIKTSLLLSLFEIIVKPVIKILLLPINLITLGLFRSVIDTLGLYLVVFLLSDFQVKNIHLPSTSWYGFGIPDLKFNGFFAFLVSSIVIGLIYNIFNALLTRKIKT